MKLTPEQGTMIVDSLIGEHMAFLSSRAAANPEGFNGLVKTIIERTQTYCEQHLSPNMEHKNKTVQMLTLKDELLDLVQAFRAGTAANFCRKAVDKPKIVKPTHAEVSKIVSGIVKH